MSKYDNRMKRQSKENQDLYYAWIEECERLGDPNPDSMKVYKSSVTEFFETCINGSILDVEIETIERFIHSPKLKLSRRTSKLDFLMHFLRFVKRRSKPRWNFEIEDLPLTKPDSKETKQSVESAEPLTAKELIRLYEFFNNHLHDPKWLKSYLVFRLMYYYHLDKVDISKINKDTLDTTTGELRLNGKDPLKFDDEITRIFRSKGSDFLPSNSYDVYRLLTSLGKVLERRITQTAIDRTKDRFKIRCPQCGYLIENDPSLVGFVQVDILNLGSLILCKTCLENE